MINPLRKISMKAFGHPTGLLGKIGGKIMARMNRPIAEQAIDLLDIRPDDKVLEIGFGPGVGIEVLSGVVSTGLIAGVEPSEEMMEQAKSRNAEAIQSRQVNLQRGSIERLPFEDDLFDKALSINSMPFWPDAKEGLDEINRTLKSGGKIVLGFTHHSGQSQEGVEEKLHDLGFADTRLVKGNGHFYLFATKR